MHHGSEALDFLLQNCILFSGARMRALQLGRSDPQAWVLYSFHGATYANITYAIVICAHYCMGQNRFCSFMEAKVAEMLLAEMLRCSGSCRAVTANLSDGRPSARL